METSMNNTMVDKIVLSGDTFENLRVNNEVIMLGPGLRQHINKEVIVVTRSGVLCHKPPNVHWVDGHQKRYTPKKGELVVGVVAIMRGDILKVDIGSSEMASLSTYAFEGVTKKQKPVVIIGDVIYARVLSANRDMEPELVCVDSYFQAGKLGPLSNEGFVFNINTDFAHKLLKYENPLLETLGKKTPFEIAIGMNGKVWIMGKSTKDVDTIITALLAAQNKSVEEMTNLCRKY